MVSLFGPDGCFGLAWTLVHLIETSPGWPIEGCITQLQSEWIVRLRERAERAGFLTRSGERNA
jgi:hypothetical protein